MARRSLEGLALGLSMGLLPAGGASAGYEHVRVAVSVPVDAASGRFQDLWRVGPMGQLAAETPSAVGEIGVLVWGARARARSDGLPDLWMFGGAASLWLERSVGAGLRVAAGAAFGMQTMHATGPETRGRPSTESEYVVDAGLRAAVPLRGRLALTGEVRRRTLLTHEHIAFTHLALGAALAFETPAWLRGLLE